MRRPSTDMMSPTPTNPFRNGLGHRDKKSHFPRYWLWLFICLAGFLLTGCSEIGSFVNVTRDPSHDQPRLASILPPRWAPTPGVSEITRYEQLFAIFRSESKQGRVREREVVVPHEIGYSVEGRPLEVFRFGNGPRNLLIVAGIHGGYEWNTIMLAEQLIEYLTTNQHLIPSDVQLHILPSLNPDGEARAHNFLGRGNANNVDLNRNWNVNWRSVLPQFGCWNIVRLTGGSQPLSEPESKALMRYILNTEFEAIISYHSAGLGIFAGGLPATQKSLDLAETISEVSTYPYPPIDIGCDYTGTFIDWAAWIGIAAIDIELSTHFYTDFEQNLRILDAFLNWTPAN